MTPPKEPSVLFEELDHQPTRLGDISLRTRVDPGLDVQVYEVKLGEEFLMSSLFTAAEQALATRGLAQLDHTRGPLDVVVGGLGLGYTAAAVLDDDRVRTLDVVEALEPVISWHRRHLVPLGERLAGDPRCTFVLADFFATIGAGVAPNGRAASYDAILLDVDHSPTNLLSDAHAGFYQPEGLARCATLLRPGGVFGLWADGDPDDRFVAALDAVFDTVAAELVTFPNPYTGGTSASTVYLTTTGAPPPTSAPAAAAGDQG